jgi:lysophospholipase L1-like esterase
VTTTHDPPFWTGRASRASRTRVATIVVALGILLAGCTAAHPSTLGALPPTPATKAGLYVAIGAGDSRGEGTDNPLREAWTQLFFRSLPLGYAFVNLASGGATTADALGMQLPQAEALHPTVVTVSLNVNDVLGSVPPDRYQTELTLLVHGLRSGGATVLLATTPPVETLAAYLACEDPVDHPGGCPSFMPKPVPAIAVVTADVAAFNAVIAHVATSEGAVLVDLDSTDVTTGGASERASSPFGADGFDPSVAGAEAIAARFEAAWRKQPSPG